MPEITITEVNRIKRLIKSGNIDDPCYMLDVIMERKTKEPEVQSFELLESDTQEN